METGIGAQVPVVPDAALCAATNMLGVGKAPCLSRSDVLRIVDAAPIVTRRAILGYFRKAHLHLITYFGTEDSSFFFVRNLMAAISKIYCRTGIEPILRRRRGNLLSESIGD